MNRGLTLIELMVGMVTATIIAAVCAKVLLLGITTYNYAARQNASLTRTRRALGGEGAKIGVLGASRMAYSLSDIQSSSVAVLSPPAAVVTNYYVTSGGMYRTMGGVSTLQAEAISSLSVNYYMATAGMISSTTVVSSATMVTALVTIGTGTTSAQKTYTLFAGAQLRNHP